MFESLVWRHDSVRAGSVELDIQQDARDARPVRSSRLHFFKTPTLTAQYDRLLGAASKFAGANVFELGIWDGGSAAVWCEMLEPRKLVCVDIRPQPPSDALSDYIRQRNASSRLKTYWGVDQSDKNRLRQIAADEFDQPLDIVVDDASHLYDQSLASFEALFPLLPPGGLYCIEDWAWSFHPEYHSPDHSWSALRPLSDLAVLLVEAAGTPTNLIANVKVAAGLVVAERGQMEVDTAEDFALESYINRRPHMPRVHPSLAGLKGLAPAGLRRSVKRMLFRMRRS